ncbi:hypothetical protein LPUS_05108 [Lasallia pustulata]|uniref:Extracellular membrane protein CFEM domain-containing protein n=1 Tax=Lasallia pustulata TaxID=136370 RepID=A0A1W5CY12_9LECA|nr:hypothetical protein LPUS_05108 [Lasallia pustulata]
MKPSTFIPSHPPFYLSLSLSLLLLLPLFPTPAQTITYYSDVPLYSSLVQCASGACDDVLSSISNCGSLSPVSPYASCACLKDQNSATISSSLTFMVKIICGSAASEDVTSVLDVFHSWCQAVAPSNSVTTTATTAAASTSPTATPGSGVAPSTATSTSFSSSSQPDPTSLGSTSSGVAPSTATSTSSSSSSQPDPSSPGSTSSGLSNGQWAAIGIVVAVVAIVVGAFAALCAGWTRPEQFLWVLTCGVMGSRHRKPRHQRVKPARVNGLGWEGTEMGPVGWGGGHGQGGGGGSPAWVQGAGWQGQGQGQGPWQYR